MVRTICVLAGGILLGFVVLGGLIWISSGANGFSITTFFLLASLTGAIVGGVVGFLQRDKAAQMAILCLLPAIFFEYLTPYRLHHPPSAQGLALLLLGSVFELSIAFAAAYVVSKHTQSLMPSVNQTHVP